MPSSRFETKIGRLTYWGPLEQDGIIYLLFYIPSKSKRSSRVYKILVDPFTLQSNCACEFKEIHRMTVTLTSLPEPCCWHLKHLAQWIRRKANKQKLEDIRLALGHYYELARKSA